MIRRLIAPFLFAAILSFTFAPSVFSKSDSDKVYSKRRDLPLLEAASSGSKQAAKADWNEEMIVVARENRWLKVRARDGEGWVYIGNVSVEKIPEENKNDLPMQASTMSAAAAGRGLSAGASQYAGRHSLGEVADQLRWAEKLNAGISKDEARAYLKSHKLGEYADAK